MSTIIGTSFATAGFKYDANLSPNNQSFSAAVLAVLARAGGAGGGGGTASALSTAVFANPSSKVSTTATNGTSTFAMRADAAPGIDMAMSPLWTGTHNFSSAARIVLGPGTGLPWGLTGIAPAAISLGQTGGFRGRLDAAGWQLFGGIYDNGTNFIFTGTGTDNTGTSTGLIVSALNGTFSVQFGGNGTSGQVVAALPAALSMQRAGLTITGTNSANLTPLTIAAGVGTVARAIIQFSDPGGRAGFVGMGAPLSAGGDIFPGGTAGDCGVRASSGRVVLYGPGGLGGTGVWGWGPTNGMTDMTPDAGQWTGTAIGFTTTVTGVFTWSRNGNQVTVNVPALTGTSNSTSFAVNGVPAAIQPARNQICFAPFVTDAGVASNNAHTLVQSSSGTMVFRLNNNTTGWTVAGGKAIQSTYSFTYLLN